MKDTEHFVCQVNNFPVYERISKRCLP